jgi:hypothetical protein
MAFDASKIRPDRIAAAREKYQTMTSGRAMAAGVKDAGGMVDPFDKQADGSYSLNPWLHANNQNPHRGNVTFKNYKGENETVPYWQADRAFSANLGLTGFEDISNQLKDLQSSFAESLRSQSNLNFANLGEQTGKKYFTIGRKGKIKQA